MFQIMSSIYDELNWTVSLLPFQIKSNFRIFLFTQLQVCTSNTSNSNTFFKIYKFVFWPCPQYDIVLSVSKTLSAYFIKAICIMDLYSKMDLYSATYLERSSMCSDCNISLGYIPGAVAQTNSLWSSKCQCHWQTDETYSVLSACRS